MLFATFFVLITISGCSSSTPQSYRQPEIKISGKSINLSDSKTVRKILKQHHAQWRNVKHKLGGLSQNGIDCSGLVYNVFKNKFGITIPRSTELQSNIGKTINRKQIKAGDLVFFKTGLFKRHVGIYIENGKFLHVSTSKGVIISSLKNTYWANAYWKTQRVTT